jgi:hypothetical protein
MAVAVNVTLVPAHIAPAGLAAIITLAGKFGFTVIVIIFDVAGDPVAQIAFDVMMHVIWLPLVKALEVYVEFVAPPIFDPLFSHWYVGVVPPFVAVAVIVILVPAQIAPGGTAAIITPAGKFGFTVIVILFDVAGDPDTQLALEVIIQVTTSLLFSAALVYVELFVPTLLPFTCH